MDWPTGEILTWTYDAADQRRTRETSIGVTTYSYDANSQLVKLENEHEEVTTFVYDPVGREQRKELANETVTSFTYDAAGRTTAVLNSYPNGDIISRFTYSYDPASNRTSESREDGTIRLWKYDPGNQLISEQRTEGTSWETLSADDWGDMGVSGWSMLPALSTGGPITTYVYDPVGNRLVLNVDGERTTSTYDAANRLINAEDIHGITTYTFDPNGNQRTVETPDNEVTTYSWNFENQLVQIEEPDDVVTTQVYAPVNRNGVELRISKETGTGLTQFVYDDQNIIQEVDDTSTVEAEYSYNPQAYGNLISQRSEDESTFYNYDALGSTESLTDESATKTDEYAYDAFGKELFHTGTTENKFTWVGELGYYRDADGRYDLRARQYEAAIARFLSEDPLKFDAGDTNFYPYVGNNPTNAVDPSGRAPEWHHLLPKAFVAKFRALGFRINDAQWGWILDAKDHDKLHPLWNTVWEDWFTNLERKGTKITKEMVIAQLNRTSTCPE